MEGEEEPLARPKLWVDERAILAAKQRRQREAELWEANKQTREEIERAARRGHVETLVRTDLWPSVERMLRDETKWEPDINTECVLDWWWGCLPCFDIVHRMVVPFTPNQRTIDGKVIPSDELIDALNRYLTRFEPDCPYTFEWDTRDKIAIARFRRRHHHTAHGAAGAGH